MAYICMYVRSLWANEGSRCCLDGCVSCSAGARVDILSNAVLCRAAHNLDDFATYTAKSRTGVGLVTCKS